MTKHKHAAPPRPPAHLTPYHDLTRKDAGDVHLGNFLRASYGHEAAIDKLARKGFVRDAQLSNHNQSVYVNGRTKKMVFAAAGTHNLDDVATDLVLAFGGDRLLKQTKRYGEAEATLARARQKYQNYGVSLTGHSLGGSLVSSLGKPNELVVTHNKGAGFRSAAPRPNEQAFRHSGDVVSLLSANAKNMTTLPTQDYTPLLGPHAISNLRGQKVFV